MNGRPLSLERMLLFSDAIFAIAITILVLPLTADITLDGAQGVTEQLSHMQTQILAFGIGFFVIGQFWLAHHRLGGELAITDSRLLGLNLVALCTIAFLPFPTAVLGARDTDTDHGPVVFFAASMAVASLALSVLWFYASRSGLTDPAIGPAERRVIDRRSWITVAGFVVAIGVAFIGLLPAILMWVVVVPGVRRLLSPRAAST